MAAPRRISRDAIVSTALAIVDEEGLDALTARSLADRLAVGPSALYYHFRDMDEIRCELAWLVAEKTIATPRSATWQSQVRDRVHALRDSLLAHPNIIPLLVGPLGPQISAREYVGFAEELEAFIGLMVDDGFSVQDALAVLEAFEAFTIATVAISVRPPVQAPATVPLLVGQLLERSHLDAQERFELGLEALITGFDQLMKRRPQRPRPAKRAANANGNGRKRRLSTA